MGKIRKALEECVIEEVHKDYAFKCITEGKTVSSAFLMCYEEGEEEKGILVENLHEMNNLWNECIAKLETIPTF